LIYQDSLQIDIIDSLSAKQKIDSLSF